MKKILLSVVLVCGMVLIMNLLLNAFVYKRLLPYYWGSTEIADKRAYLLQNKAQYNALFIGSSKTHNQIIPELFDQKAKEAGLNIRSYNYGISGLTSLEALHIYENLLLKDSLKFKYAFVELDWISTINYENLNVARSYYWLDNKNYTTSVKSILNSSVPLTRRAWGLFHYTLDYSENLMNIGKVNEYVKLQTHTAKRTFSKEDSIAVHQGYTPLDEDMRPTEQDLYNEVLTAAKSTMKNFNALSGTSLSQPFLERLQEILKISEERGITTYFVVPMQWKYYQYRELIPVINAIGLSKVICLFDIDKYQHVYKPEYFADPNHLNAKGAEYYTTQLFENFKSQCAAVNVAKK
jgi:hypothetical protein